MDARRGFLRRTTRLLVAFAFRHCSRCWPARRGFVRLPKGRARQAVNLGGRGHRSPMTRNKSPLPLTRFLRAGYSSWRYPSVENGPGVLGIVLRGAESRTRDSTPWVCVSESWLAAMIPRAIRSSAPRGQVPALVWNFWNGRGVNASQDGERTAHHGQGAGPAAKAQAAIVAI